ncbi:thiamine pyrophosphate-binding protein [Isoptericola halotolerans]|uniref:thiamine pyrophosphate-binding protein n=1 Tax=Isoptericola halotolerans TaxID=300560 RepID=UPI0038902DD0
MNWTGADLLLDLLARAGVRRLFGVPGGPLLSLLERVDSHPDLEFVLAKHEEGAVFMAEGFAQAGGGLGVACVSSGPGTMHAVTAAASATSDGAPVLLLAGQVPVPLFGRGALQDSSGGDWSADLVDMFRSVTKLSALVTDTRQLEFLTLRAITAATSPVPGTAHLALPADVLAGPAPRADVAGSPETSPPHPDPAAVRELAEAILSARRPLVLAGQGAKNARSEAGLVDVAERLSMAVATTMKGKSAFPERHPLSLGVYGTYGMSPHTPDAVLDDEVDLLLVLGSSLGEVSTVGWDERLVKNRTVWQVDVDRRQLGRAMRADHLVQSDVALLLHALADELDARGIVRPTSSVEGSVTRSAEATAEHSPDSDVLQGSQVARVLDRRLPDDTLLLIDNGNSLSWIGEHYRAGAGREVYCSLNVGCMGYTVPAAVGVALARPDRPVVAVVGDAAFAMTCPEIHTAAELGIGGVWVVLNNAGNAMVANLQELMFSRAVGSMYAAPIDVATVALGFGARAAVVRTAADLEAALDEVLDDTPPTGPVVLDVRVDPDEVAWSLRARAETLKVGG